jgi:hypothetical protein
MQTRAPVRHGRSSNTQGQRPTGAPSEVMLVRHASYWLRCGRMFLAPLLEEHRLGVVGCRLLILAGRRLSNRRAGIVKQRASRHGAPGLVTTAAVNTCGCVENL